MCLSLIHISIEIKKMASPPKKLTKVFDLIDKSPLQRGTGAILCMADQLGAFDQMCIRDRATTVQMNTTDIPGVVRLASKDFNITEEESTGVDVYKRQVESCGREPSVKEGLELRENLV